MPSVSVLIRLYNGIEFLEESLTSVLDQTYKDFEVIIGVNGHGITSETYSQASAILARKADPRIRLKNYPHVRGGAEAMNALIADARADWVAILDVDDMWHRDKLDTQVFVRDTVPDVHVIGTLCKYFGSSDSHPSIPSGRIDPSVFKVVNPVIHSSALIKKENLYYTDFCGLDDYDLWCRLVKEGKTFYTIGAVLTFHRVHTASFYNSSKKQDPEALRKHYFS
jgi:glycosyltransferase involved in cell wall biosynthesis